MAVPYFFGGIAKLDPDWLSCDTVTMFFIRESRLETFGPHLSHPLVVQCVTYGGLLFDLLVSPLLLWKRTRIPTFVVAVLFHLTNSQLFNIGIFPWLMIGATTIFFSPDWPMRILRLGTTDSTPSKRFQPLRRKQRMMVIFVGVYAIIQVTLPLRQFFYPNPNWTDEGQNFCWRMMLRRKLNESRIVAVDKQTGRRGTIRSEEYLTPRQIHTMSGSPDMLLQFSHFLDRTLREERKNRGNWNSCLCDIVPERASGAVAG